MQLLLLCLKKLLPLLKKFILKELELINLLILLKKFILKELNFKNSLLLFFILSKLLFVIFLLTQSLMLFFKFLVYFLSIKNIR